MNRSSTRRECLQLLLGGIAASCWSPTGGLELSAPYELERLRKILLALFWETLGVPTIAEAYLRAVPGEHPSPLALTRAILGQTSLSAVPRLTAAAIRRSVVRQIQVDFLHNRIVHIDGWILSMTEARLYELARADRTPRKVRALQLVAAHGGPRQLLAPITRDPDGRHFLVAFIDVAEHE